MAVGELTLWGSHPAYVDGEPIKLTIGTLGEVRASQRQRERDGGWLLAIYKWGTEPVGLREQVKARQREAQASDVAEAATNEATP